MNSPLMNDDLIHTLTGLYSVKLDKYESERDLFSDTYKSNRKRITSDKYDYDLGMKIQE